MEGNANIPGPGTYKEIQTFGKEGKKITLKSRQKDFSIPQTHTPGPGTYSILKFN